MHPNPRRRVLRATLASAVVGVTPFTLLSAVAHADVSSDIRVEEHEGEQLAFARLADGKELVVLQRPGEKLEVHTRDAAGTLTPAEPGMFALASGHQLNITKGENGAGDWFVSLPGSGEPPQMLCGDGGGYCRMIMPTSMITKILKMLSGQ